MFSASLLYLKRAWKDISIDFITYLPKSNSYDTILVIVYRLTKFRYFIPCRGTINAEDIAYLFRDYI